MLFKIQKTNKGTDNSNSIIKSENKITPTVSEWFKKKPVEKINNSKIETTFETKENGTKNKFSDMFNKFLLKKKSNSQSVCTQTGLKNFETTDIKTLNQRTVWKDRIDIKYMTNVYLLDSLLQTLSADYLILENKGNCVSQYTSEYLDTVDYKFLRGDDKVKHKIRKRRYNGEDGFWLEIKEVKDDILKKYRIFNPTPSEFETFIRTNTPYTSIKLNSSIFTCYDRMTFMHKTLPLKITLDTNLKVKNGNRLISFNDLMIIELKSRKNDAASFSNIIESSLHIKSCRVSKYQLGMASLHPELKKNVSPDTLLNIKKICKIKL
jgi:hypothetical protein